jgi:predicted ester cyclase
MRAGGCIDIIEVMAMTETAAFGGMTADAAKALAIRSMQIMVDGSRSDFDEVVHPEAVNREAKDEPPESRGRGPAAFYATALWLRGWFDDLAFEVHDVVAEGDLVVVHNTMSGRQTGPAVIYGADGQVAQVMPATGKRFATTQTHWLRMRDGKVVEHWANRDDQGTAMQLGWIPPTPWFLFKAAIATRRARRGEAARRGDV